MGKQSRIKAQRRAERAKISSAEKPLDPTVPRLPPRTEGEYKSQGPNDLFDNPMTKAAMSALSEEDRERYQKMGQFLYENVDYENSTANMPASMSEAVAYVEMQIRSGLHISSLDENEQALMKERYGEEWYKKWGYVKEDLTEIVTLDPVLVPEK